MKQHTVTIAGEELVLTLEGAEVTLATGGEVITTECGHPSTALNLYREVRSDLNNESLFLEEVDGTFAICSSQPDGTVRSKLGSFTTFKDFVKWGIKNYCNLY